MSLEKNVSSIIILTKHSLEIVTLKATEKKGLRKRLFNFRIAKTWLLKLN